MSVEPSIDREAPSRPEATTPWFRSARVGLVLALVGSVVFWVGLPWPVVGDFFDAEDDAARIVLVEDNRGQFAAAFGLLGVGASIAAVGLWVLGMALAPLEAVKRGRRYQLAALIAAWSGGIGVISGVGRLLGALFATPEFLVDGGWTGVALSIPGWWGTCVALVIFGWLGIKAPPPTWACIVLILGGLAGLVTFLPLFFYTTLIVFVIPTLVRMRRLAVDTP